MDSCWCFTGRSSGYVCLHTATGICLLLLGQSGNPKCRAQWHGSVKREIHVNNVQHSTFHFTLNTLRLLYQYHLANAILGNYFLILKIMWNPKKHRVDGMQGFLMLAQRYVGLRSIIISSKLTNTHAVAQFVEAMRYKSEGRGSDSRKGHSNFSFTYPSGCTITLGSTQHITRIPGIFPGGLRRPVRKADNLTTFMCQLSQNMGASASWNTQCLK